jgi:putative endonuclease
MGPAESAARHLTLGRAGERAAARWLSDHGYPVLGRGFLTRRGEIDLVCRRGDALVLVEVKTRSSTAFGTPLEAVGPRKRRALEAAAREYRALAGWRGPLRFAVFSLLVGDDGSIKDAELIEDPF